MIINNKQLKKIIRQAILKEGMFDMFTGLFGSKEEASPDVASSYVVTKEDIREARNSENLGNLVAWLLKKQGYRGLEKSYIVSLVRHIVNEENLSKLTHHYVVNYPYMLEATSTFVFGVLPFVSDLAESRPGTRGDEVRRYYLENPTELPPALGSTPDQKREIFKLYIENLKTVIRERRDYTYQLAAHYWPEPKIDRDVHVITGVFVNVTSYPDRFLALLPPNIIRYLDKDSKESVKRWFIRNFGERSREFSAALDTLSSGSSFGY